MARPPPARTRKPKASPTKPTDKKQATPAATDLHVQLLNSVSEAVIATDLSGKVLFWNAVAERLYGWTWEQAVGRQIEELLVTPNSRAAAAKIMKQLRQGKSWSGKFKVRRRDGTEFIAVPSCLIVPLYI
jgi:PAS domain S-box-containing protein